MTVYITLALGFGAVAVTPVLARSGDGIRKLVGVRPWLSPAGSTINAAVLTATQTSFDEAPERYPEIHQKVEDAVQDAAKTKIAYNDSHNLNSCGTSTALAAKWQAFLNETKLDLTYHSESLKMEILSNGVRVNATVSTAFATPIWAGFCAWNEVVSNRS